MWLARLYAFSSSRVVKPTQNHVLNEKYALNNLHFTVYNYVGVTIIRDQFSVGSSAMARCSSDNLAARMEWLNNEVVVASAISTQQLNLMFSPVNDSIHNQVYVCRVTRDGENGMLVTAVQNFTANVDGKKKFEHVQ